MGKESEKTRNVYMYIELNHFALLSLKLTQHCKSTTFQLKNSFKNTFKKMLCFLKIPHVFLSPVFFQGNPKFVPQMLWQLVQPQPGVRTSAVKEVTFPAVFHKQDYLFSVRLSIHTPSPSFIC